MNDKKLANKYVSSASGWRNLPYYSGTKTTVFTVVTIINFLALSYSYSELGHYSKDDGFQLAEGPANSTFYTYSIVGIIVCILDSFLITYESTEARWGGRFISSYAPALFMGYLIYFSLQ